jgi:hypothetical protein
VCGSADANFRAAPAGWESDGRSIGFVHIIDPAREETRYWGEIESGFRFYERLGFKPVERQMLGADDCLIYRLSRRARRVNSTRRTAPWRTPSQQAGAPRPFVLGAKHRNGCLG